MESLLPFPFSGMSRRRRNILLACCAIGAGGYVSHRVYTSASVTRKRLQLYRFFHSLSSLLEAAAQGSDCVRVLWKDLYSFLLSNEDEVPQSLKQLFKVGRTREFRTSVALLCKSVTQGVVSGLSEQLPLLQEGADYGSVLYEEWSSQEGVRRIGKSGRDLGYRERTDGRYCRRGRRRRSPPETDGSQGNDAGEDDYRLGKLGRSQRTSGVFEDEDGDEEEDEDEAGRYRAGGRSWAGTSIAETSKSGGRGKSRSPIKRIDNLEGREEGLPGQLVGKIFSEAGRGFASAVVASATRSLVLSVLDGMREANFLGEASCSTVGREAKDSNDPQPKETAKNGVSSEEELQKPVTSSSSSGTFQDGVINFICSSKGKSLFADCIETFIGTAVSVYLDKTRDENVFDEILTTVSRPAHRDSVKDLLTSVCNGALVTLIRASHEVLSGSSSSVPPPQSEAESTQFGVGSRRDVRRLTFSLGKSSCFNRLEHSDVGESGECGQCEGGNDHFVPGSPPTTSPDSVDSESLNCSGMRTTRIAFDHSPQTEKKLPLNDLEKAEVVALPSPSYRQVHGKAVRFPSKSAESFQGLIEGVSRTLAVPSNRALVLDVASTVTAEAVRSTIDVMLSKVSLALRGKAEKVSASERSPGPSKVMRVVNKTGELAQATASKALVAMTMCLAICLHTLLGQSTVLEHA